MSGKCLNFIEWYPSAYSFYQNENFVNTKKTLEKQKLNFSPSALFHLKTRVSLKYFLNDSRTHTRKLVASYLLEIEIFGIKFGMCDKTAVSWQAGWYCIWNLQKGLHKFSVWFWVSLSIIIIFSNSVLNYAYNMLKTIEFVVTVM